MIETGYGPPLVLIHGTGSPGLFFLPLLERLENVRAIAADRPGHGLSDPAELPRERYRQAAVAWVDRLLDALDLDDAALLAEPELARHDPGLDSLVNVNEPDDYAAALARPEPEVVVERFGALAGGGRRGHAQNGGWVGGAQKTARSTWERDEARLPTFR